VQNTNNIILYLICLIPPALVAGPFIADSLVVIINILFFYTIIKTRKFEYFKNIFFIVFSLFYFTLIISSLNSDNIFYSLKSSLPYFRHGVFALAIIYTIDQNKDKFLKLFFKILLITFSVLTLDGLFQYFMGFNIVGLHHIHPDRITSFFVQELKLGSYLARMMPIVIAFLIYFGSNNKAYIFLSVILIILVDILIFISMERSAFFLTMLSIIFILIFTKKYKLIRFLCFVVSVLIIITLTVKDEALKNRMLLHPIQALTETVQKKYVLTAVHDSLYKTSLKMFDQNKIFGVGPKMYRKQCRNEKYTVNLSSCNSHPHNTYIQMLAETGLVGFGFFIFFVFTFFYKTIIHFKNLITKRDHLSDFTICIMGSIFINIWPIIPTGNFFNNWMSIVYYLPLGFYFSSLCQTKKNSN
jgi:O-antigen ligase